MIDRFILAGSVFFLSGFDGIQTDLPSDNDSVVYIFLNNSQIENRINKLFYEKFEKRIDLLIYHLEMRGYSCSEYDYKEQFDYFCDLIQRVKLPMDSENIIWVEQRRNVLIEDLGDDMRLRVVSHITAP